MNHVRRVFVFALSFLVVQGVPQNSRDFPARYDETNGPTISTTHGHLRGQWLTSTQGKKFAAFKGVPYATPPIGDLRFEPPQQAEPWTGVRDALEHGAQCPQMVVILNTYIGDEDCLYLNVYSPQRDSDENLFPIMIFIHGGAWVMGAGDMDEYPYGPDRFMDEKVIMVTINYRLGVLGFLHLKGLIAGNMGLKDQRMALKWIHANARSFGGDPDRIVLMGNSAGAGSGELHAINEESRKLISGVIAQSGSALANWAWNPPEELMLRARRLAKLVSCPDDRSRKSILECFKRAPANDLIVFQLFSGWDLVQLLISLSFTPTSEPIGTPDPFLQDCPRNLFTRMTPTSERSLSYLTGYTTAEAAIFEKLGASFLDVGIGNIVRSVLGLPSEDKNVTKLRQKSYLTRVQSQPTILNELIANLQIKAPVIDSTRFHANAGANVYLYHFKFAGRNNIGRLFFDGNESSHMDELSYLFQGRGFFGTLPPMEEGSPEGRVSAQMLRMWTNFAKTGNPTPENNSGIDVIWPRGPTKLLIIDTELSIGTSTLKPDWHNFLKMQCER